MDKTLATCGTTGAFSSTACVCVCVFICLSSATILPKTNVFETASGRPICKYVLGGAARSIQPQSLVGDYVERLTTEGENGAPVFFYYNPHRYPEFMSGIRDVCSFFPGSRQNLFVSSGGTERSFQAMQQRLKDALVYCGGECLDLFVLEYICPYELNSDDLRNAMAQAHSWVKQGLVRCVAASTHSHRVGATLAEASELDALMFRYSMSHKDAADNISFPAARKHGKPVIAFTTTRWNKLQAGHKEWKEIPVAPTTADCLDFALAVEVVLHSARNKEELHEAMNGLRGTLPTNEMEQWRRYGDLDWNEDGFDEYPEERLT